MASLAATPGTPPPPPEPEPDLLSRLLVPGILALIVVGVVSLAVLRPSVRRPMAWIALVLVFLAGFLYILAGLFGDLSGEHRIFVLALVIGIAMMVLAVAGAIRLRRTEPRAAPASPERQQ